MTNLDKALTDKNKGPTDEELLRILLEKKLLSGAQVEVARIDSASSGLSSADVLLARKWITEQALAEFYTNTPNIAPKSGTGTEASGQQVTSALVQNTQAQSSTVQGLSSADGADSDEQIYLQNLRKYRQLMSKIMGETD